MTPLEDRDPLERLLASSRPAPVWGLGERAFAAATDRAFARRIAWIEAGDAARWILWIAGPLLVVSAAVVVASVSRRASPHASPFQPSFRAGPLGTELE